MYKHNIPSIFNFVHQPTKALGEEAVNLLLNMINNPTEVKVKNIVLETSFLLHGDRKLSGIVA
jgi:DNA-binding LacI/PurR family transcriptional regulator